MHSRHWIEMLLIFCTVLFLSVPLSKYFKKVYQNENHWLKFLLGAVENFIYRTVHIDPEEQQSWRRYASSLLGFSSVTFVFTFLLLRQQHLLPFNPQNFDQPSAQLTLNTAISFLTNTNWQSYGGENTMSYFSQMVPLTFQNFISAAVGMAVSISLIRSVTPKESKFIGNFWTDLTRSIIYILLPAAFIFAIFLISQGVIQNFEPYLEVTNLEGYKQLLPQGPVASQAAIKLLGTNGGGFFNANSAHPFENPTPLSNIVQMIALLLIPSTLIFTLGRFTDNLKHAWSLWIAMFLLCVAGIVFVSYWEHQGNPLFARLGLPSNLNFEGKELRFGIFNSAVFSVLTTATSTGAVNSMLDSFTPLGGLLPMFNMMTGEVCFGGVGVGLCSIVIFVILTVFIAGLMVGRTPEYFGKKIEGNEVKFAMIACIIQAICILTLTALATILPQANAYLNNNGPHGFSEMLYAFTSATQNNGSSFAGLNSNNSFWNVSLAVAMFVGRFLFIIPVLAIAGSLASKKVRPQSTSSFPVYGGTFVSLLLGVIIILGGLTYLPAVSLGPVVEHFQMQAGKLF